MKININNHAKLDAAINLAEKRCSARTVNAKNIQAMIKSLEKQLVDRLYKKDWKGLRFMLDYHGQSFPGAYKGTPESTQVLAERGASAWFATVITRDTCNSMETYPLNLETKSVELAQFVQDYKNWN